MPTSSPNKRSREWTWSDDDRDCSHRLKGDGGCGKQAAADEAERFDMGAILKSIAKGDSPPKRAAAGQAATTAAAGVEYVNYDFEPMHHAGCCYDECFVAPPPHDIPPDDELCDERPPTTSSCPDNVIVPDKARRHAYT
jgi:hypothetical protein